MAATMENVRALVVMDGAERYEALKRKPADYLHEIKDLATQHSRDILLKVEFAMKARQPLDVDVELIAAINTRIVNVYRVAREILRERAYPNTPSRATAYCNNEQPVSAEQYKELTTTLARYCREHKE